MSYEDVDSFYSASYHTGEIIRNKGFATHDEDSLSSFDNFLITLETQASEDQHRNVAIYEDGCTPSFVQDSSLWPREDIEVRIVVRAKDFLVAYTRAHKICRAVDKGYRSFFNVWDGNVIEPAEWQIKYEYGGLWRRSGPYGEGRDDKWRAQIGIVYNCNRRVKEVQT